VLGKDVLRTGRSVNINFGNARRGNLWDLKVVTSEGDTYTWTDAGFNLPQTGTIRVFMRDGRAVATAEGSIAAD